jgi:hypothetical protein
MLPIKKRRYRWTLELDAAKIFGQLINNGQLYSMLQYKTAVPNALDTAAMSF